MDKESVVYACDGILCSLKKGKPATCYNMDEPWGHDPEQNNPVIKEQILCHYWYKVSKVVKITETENEKVVAKYISVSFSNHPI